MNRVTIRLVDPADRAARAACFAVRKAVFCVEQQVPEHLEWDGLDDACRHFLAEDGGVAVGTARLRPYDNGTAAKIERVAVLRTARGRGIGLLLMQAALDDAWARGFAAAVLNAQTAVEGFYAQLGFRSEGEVFVEAGIPHIHMRLTLAGRAEP
ncbi:MAG: GNAT family N-acetyltransferase [Rhodospirillaceae bacterium]|nr:GNAT family N-acetyltransferase [Rhodospirillaceae bacterium]